MPGVRLVLWAGCPGKVVFPYRSNRNGGADSLQCWPFLHKQSAGYKQSAGHKQCAEPSSPVVVGQGNPQKMIVGIAYFHNPAIDIILSDMFNFDDLVSAGS